MMQLTRVVEETEKQRSDDFARGLIAKSSDDAVCGSDTLNFQHAAFARYIGKVQAFCDDAISPAQAAVEPAQGHSAIRRRTCELDPLLARKTGDQIFQGALPRFERSVGDLSAIRVPHAIEGNEGCRVFTRQSGDAAGGGM